jgi:hypothetical protein
MAIDNIDTAGINNITYCSNTFGIAPCGYLSVQIEIYHFVCHCRQAVITIVGAHQETDNILERATTGLDNIVSQRLVAIVCSENMQYGLYTFHLINCMYTTAAPPIASVYGVRISTQFCLEYFGKTSAARGNFHSFIITIEYWPCMVLDNPNSIAKSKYHL